MKTIEGATVLATLPVSGLRQVRDLIYVDGPLLSQFVHPKGDSYLYYWCDCNESQHRWMVIRVSEFRILQLRYQIIPLDLVIPSANLDDYVYFVDSGENGVEKVWMCPNASISEDYTPGTGAFLDSECEEDPDQFAILLDGDIGTKELLGIPRLTELLYSFQYSIDVLGIKHVNKQSWGGGYSSSHFDNWITKAPPHEDRLDIDRLMVASPGFVQFNGQHRVFDKIIHAVNYLIENRREISKSERHLLDYISSNNSWEGYHGDDASWKEKDEELKRRLESFLDKFSVLTMEVVVRMTSTIFEAAQVARWFYRRVNKLSKSVESGNVTLPPTLSRDPGED